MSLHTAGNNTDIDYEVMAEALLYSRTTAEDQRDVLPRIVSIQAMFYNMSEVPGAPGTHQDISVDNEAAIKVLVESGYDGYLNSEYEGQRYFHDRGLKDLNSEIEQVRRHQEMMQRLIETS